MTRFAVSLTVIFMLFTAGCIPTATHEQNVRNAINDRTILTGYTKDYVMNKYGPPAEIIDNPSGGKGTQMWVYKATPNKPEIAFADKPSKEKESKEFIRYMKVLFAGNTVLDYTYE